jgi:hypothetical protein
MLVLLCCSEGFEPNDAEADESSSDYSSDDSLENEDDDEEDEVRDRRREGGRVVESACDGQLRGGNTHASRHACFS